MVDNRIILRNITSKDAGLYTCVASNSVGDGQSNAVQLQVDCECLLVWSINRCRIIIDSYTLTVDKNTKSVHNNLSVEDVFP